MLSYGLSVFHTAGWCGMPCHAACSCTFTINSYDWEQMLHAPEVAYGTLFPFFPPFNQRLKSTRCFTELVSENSSGNSSHFCSWALLTSQRLLVHQHHPPGALLHLTHPSVGFLLSRTSADRPCNIKESNRFISLSSLPLDCCNEDQSGFYNHCLLQVSQMTWDVSSIPSCGTHWAEILNSLHTRPTSDSSPGAVRFVWVALLHLSFLGPQPVPALVASLSARFARGSQSFLQGVHAFLHNSANI